MRKPGITTLGCLLFVVVTLPTRGQTERPKITGISSVNIRVDDFCAAQKFYSAVIGQHPSCSANQELAKADAGSQVMRDGQAIMLNISSSYGLPPYPKNRVEEIVFITSDATALRQYLQSHGVEMRETDVGEHGFRVRDPEGHFTGFAERDLPQDRDRPDVAFLQRSRIIHAGFVVKDREAMDKFYKDVLGFHLYWSGGMKDNETSWVSMQVPDGTDWIEYMLNIPDNADKRLLGVMNHIALGVPDVHEVARQLEAKGMKLPEQPKIGRDGKWQLNVYDPDLTRVEFMEFTPVEKPCCSEYTGPHPKP
jgi:catechol 2,3-dioxygenase-like lactoylglutathione lyase family enzyme